METIHDNSDNNLFNKLLLVITTCNTYFDNVKGLVRELEEINYPKKNVLIVSGQEESEDISYLNDIRIVKVKYSGIHLTGAIYVNENNETFNDIKYCILLPDTVSFGKKFMENIKKYFLDLIDDNIHSIPFLKPTDIKPTMDMGIVTVKHILNMSNYLNKIKTYDISYNNLIKLKKQLIHDENIILGIQDTNNIEWVKKQSDHNCKMLDKSQIKYITTKKEDVIERCICKYERAVKENYFTLLDFYKYQRNYQGFDVELVIT